MFAGTLSSSTVVPRSSLKLQGPESAPFFDAEPPLFASSSPQAASAAPSPRTPPAASSPRRERRAVLAFDMGRSAFVRTGGGGGAGAGPRAGNSLRLAYPQSLSRGPSDGCPRGNQDMPSRYRDPGHAEGETMDAMRRWGPPVAVHLILGMVALVPLWLSMMFVVNHPLAAWGITSREPTDNDGMLPWMMLLVPMWA